LDDGGVGNTSASSPDIGDAAISGNPINVKLARVGKLIFIKSI